MENLQEINLKDLWSAKAFKVPKIKKIKIKPFKFSGGEIIKFKLIDKQKRRKLAEGRNYGMGFAFAERSGENLNLVDPISPCRDYLNDRIWTQARKSSCTNYGLTTNFIGKLFENNEGYLIFSICKRGLGKDLLEYKDYQRDYQVLSKNFQNLQKFINWFEEKFNLKERSVIGQIEENKYLAICPLFWTDGTYKISLYSLLLRVGAFYVEGEPMDFLSKFKENDDDRYLVNSVKYKIEKMLGGCIPKQDLNNLNYPHNVGLVGYNLD